MAFVTAEIKLSKRHIPREIRLPYYDKSGRIKELTGEVVEIFERYGNRAVIKIRINEKHAEDLRLGEFKC